MIWVLLAVIVIFAIIFLISFFNKRKFLSQFKHGNVVVTGMRGRGKDMAFCIAVNSFKKNYISNVEYSSSRKRYKHFEFEPKVWEMAGNDFNSLVNDEIKQFTYPYPDGIDYYISDAGIYFPSQYAQLLVKKYKAAPMFQALSRQLGNCNVHCNTQNLNRLWDKIREQCDIYIDMRGCKVIGKLVFLKGLIYENAEACEKHVTPPRFGIGKNGRQQKFNFETLHGKIQRFWFVTRLPYQYDDRRFKRIFENGCVTYKEVKENEK